LQEKSSSKECWLKLEKIGQLPFPFPPQDCKLGEQGGGVAQLGERLLCKQDVVGSSPSVSTPQTPVNDTFTGVFSFNDNTVQ
jgi:hypothetical protein